jgi:hypothetical protein
LIKKNESQDEQQIDYNRTRGTSRSGVDLHQNPPYRRRIRPHSILSDLATSVGGAGGSSHLLSLGLREANYILQIGAIAGMDASALTRFLLKANKNKTRSEYILKLTSVANQLMRAINTDLDRQKSSHLLDPAFEKDAMLLDEMRSTFSNDDHIAIIKDTLLLNELVLQRTSSSATVTALDAQKKRIRTAAALAARQSESVDGDMEPSETDDDMVGDDVEFLNEGGILSAFLRFFGFDADDDADNDDAAAAEDNLPNRPARPLHHRIRKVRDAQFPVLVSEPLQTLATSNAIPLQWEYRNPSEADRVLDEASVRLRLAFEGDGVKLATEAAVASNNNTSEATSAENRLKELCKGLLCDFLFQSDATLGAAGALATDATVIGLQDDERVDFREYIALQRASVCSNTDLSLSESALSDIAQARFALSVHQSIARAYGYPVFCVASSLASRIATGVSRPVDTARSVGLLSPTVCVSDLQESSKGIKGVREEEKKKKDMVVKDLESSITVEPDYLSMELQKALMIEEALGKTTPEMLRRLRVEYVEASYDLEEEAIRMTTEKGQKIRSPSGKTTTTTNNNNNNNNNTSSSSKKTHASSKLVDAARSRGIDLSQYATNTSVSTNSFSVEPDPTSAATADNMNFDDLNDFFNRSDTVRLLDPPGHTLRRYLTRSRILPFFFERPVVLPSLLRRVGIDTSHNSNSSPMFVDLASNQLWPDQCANCGCVREEIGLYTSFLKVNEGTDEEILFCDAICKQNALTMKPVKDFNKENFQSTLYSTLKPTRLLIQVTRPNYNVKPSISYAALVFSYLLSLIRTLFQPLTYLWMSSVGTFVLRFPSFLVYEISVAWVCTAICVGISLALGRAFLSSLCVPLHIQHDPTAFVLGGYAFLLLLDASVICKYSISSACGGLVRRYAMAVARTASQLEDSFAQTALLKSRNSRKVTQVDSMSTSYANGVFVYVPNSLSSYFKVNDRNTAQHQGKGVGQKHGADCRIDLFDLAVLSCDNGELAVNYNSILGRFKLACLKFFLIYIGLPIWRNSGKEKLHIGNVHATPREMNITRLLSLAKCSLIFTLALMIGLTWASIADPVSLTLLLHDLLKRLSGFDAISTESLQKFISPALEPSWRLAGPLSSFLSVNLMGVYLISVIFEICFSGSLGETFRGWAELLEWRVISVHSTRLWARGIKPSLLLYIRICLGACLTAVLIVCATTTLATEGGLQEVCAKHVSNNSMSHQFFVTNVSFLYCSIEGAQILARLSVIAYGFVLLGVYIWSSRHDQDSIVMKSRVWLLSWSERLRRQRYSIDKALLNFKRRAQP